MKAPSFGQQQLYTMVSRQGVWADTGRGMGMVMVMELVMKMTKEYKHRLFRDINFCSKGMEFLEHGSIVK